jgi:1,4-alpha-glucan branching enzyme/maltooligosyltrehalose trehalohydrolase
MKRIQSMPFGAQVLDGNATRFRLWAPSAQRVELCLADGTPADTRMDAMGGGWHQVIVEGAGDGTRYRFRIDGDLEVPDPAARFTGEDVHGHSTVVDPRGYDWGDGAWRGRPWHEAVVYELHVGTFTPEGTFRAVESHLDHLVDLGVTAIELMPLAECPGQRNWGYDGVLLFSPEASYGTPHDLKHLIDAAHRRGLMVLLDVVYNHFGPEGNYLHAYAREFYTERHHTPWGAAINFDGRDSRAVRDFYVHNALYWLEEFHFDGLRFDAVHAIKDDSPTHILSEIAAAVRARLDPDRHVHLVLENDENEARFLRSAAREPERYDAQWNDDAHHCLHVLLAGETDGYYADYADAQRLLGRVLTQGYAYQGDASTYRQGRSRGQPSAGLPPTAFVDFLQNHDQIGNRALGERLGHLAAPDALRAGFALLLLSPHVPLLFMGEEWNAAEPFQFFCDFEPELAEKVREGRKREFGAFAKFADGAMQLPDPCAAETFQRCKLDWQAVERPAHRLWLELVKELLALRHAHIVPRLPGLQAEGFDSAPGSGLRATWRCADGSRLQLAANLSPHAAQSPAPARGEVVYSTHGDVHRGATGDLPAWSVAWRIGPVDG